MKSKLKLLLAALAIGGTIAGTTVYALSGSLVYISPGYANNTSQVIDCGNGYKTKKDWNISYDEILATEQTRISNTSELIDSFTQTGDTRTTVWKWGSGNNVGSLTLNFKAPIDGIGFYATRWQNDSVCNIDVNGHPVTLSQDGLVDYKTVERFFIPLEATQSVTISGKEKGIRWYIYSIGFYFNEIPAIESEQSTPTSTSEESVESGPQLSTLTFTAACGGEGIANNGAVWTITSDSAESQFDGTKGVHYGTSKVAVSYLRLSTSDISGTITKIVVNASGASGTSAKLNVTVGGNAFGSEQSLTSSAANYTLTDEGSGEIVVFITQSSAKKAVYCKSITVTNT